MYYMELHIICAFLVEKYILCHGLESKSGNDMNKSSPVRVILLVDNIT